MEYQVKILVDVVTEPVTLAEAKEWSMIDDDYAVNDSVINSIIRASRELLEKELNLFFATKLVECQFSQPCFRLPYGPTGDIVSIFNTGDDPYADIEYTLTGLEFKTIVMSSIDGVTWFYPMGTSIPTPWTYPTTFPNTYNVIYYTGYRSDRFPTLLKDALLTQIDWMIKRRGMPQAGSISPEAMQLAKVYSQNLPFQ